MEANIRHYKILREVGHGGMGIVYKALDTNTQKHCALKVLPPHMVDRSTVERFNREAQAMMRLSHPNTIKVFDFGAEAGKHYLVMEMVEGENLKSFIRRCGRLDETKAVDLALQMAAGIKAVHDEGMVHRDIKPANIMLTPEGKIKVMDLGLVRIADVTQLTSDGASLGTAEYMSPEQASDAGVDSRSDIYSFGITLFEMLVGEPPFKGENPQAVMLKHKEQPVPSIRQLRPDVSVFLANVLARCLQKEVAHRYQKMQEIIDDLNKLRENRNTDSPTEIGEKEIPAVPPEATAAPLPAEPPRVSVPVVPLLTGITAVILIGTGVFGYMSRGGGGNSARLISETASHLERLEKAEEYALLAGQYMSRGDYHRAVGELQKAIDIRGGYAPYYKELAVAYENTGQIVHSIEAWEAVLRYDDAGEYRDMAMKKIGELK